MRHCRDCRFDQYRIHAFLQSLLERVGDIAFGVLLCIVSVHEDR